MIPTSRIEEENSLRTLLEWKSAGATIFADTRDKGVERHVVWYSCRGYENFLDLSIEFYFLSSCRVEVRYRTWWESTLPDQINQRRMVGVIPIADIRRH